MRKIFTLIILSFSAATTISAQRLLTEDFNFVVGQITDANGGANVSAGVWKSTSGTGKYIQAVDASLSSPIYFTSPAVDSRHIVLDTCTSSAEDIKTSFAMQTGGTVYCSFLINVLTDELLNENTADTAEYFLGFVSAASNTNYQGRLYVRKGATGGTLNFGISANSYKNTPISWASNTYSLNITHLITISSSFIDGAKNDVAKLWIDQPVTNTEPVPQATSTYDALGTVSENSDLGGIAFRQSGSTASGLGSTPNCRIDAIKISTDWNDATFPVKLKSFSVALQNNNALLQWITTDEINMKEYVVERKTGNYAYSSIANISARNTSGENTYSHTDNKMLNGTNMYRIKMVDNDGTITYSNVQTALLKEVQQLLIKGNPVKDRIIVQHTAANTATTISILNSNGVTVLMQTLNVSATESTLQIAALPSGTYFLVYEQNGTREAKQFVKQ